MKDAILQEAMGLVRAKADRSFRDSCAFHGACVGEVWVVGDGNGRVVGRACLGDELPLLSRLLHGDDVGILVLGRNGRRLHVVARRARRLPTRLTGLVEPAKRPNG